MHVHVSLPAVACSATVHCVFTLCAEQSSKEIPQMSVPSAAPAGVRHGAAHHPGGLGHASDMRIWPKVWPFESKRTSQVYVSLQVPGS